MSGEGYIGIDQGEPDGAKPIWQSRTIIGAFVTILALVAGFKNFKIDVANLTDILVQVAGLVGAALAIYGRIRATQPVKFLGSTQPGGAFNPKAEVRKAQEIGDRKSEIGNQQGRADVEALMLVAAIFVLAGIALCSWPKSPETVASLPVPEAVSGKPLSQWVQVVPIVDERPFFVRLLASLRATPSTALVTTEQGTTSLRIVQVELTGGAEF